MKIYKMLVHYGAMFTIPTAIALYFYNPRTEDQKRQQLEMRHKPDIERRKKNQAKFKELLLQTEQLSDDTKKQIEEVTNFSSGRQQ